MVVATIRLLPAGCHNHPSALAAIAPVLWEMPEFAFVDRDVWDRGHVSSGYLGTLRIPMGRYVAVRDINVSFVGLLDMVSRA